MLTSVSVETAGEVSTTHAPRRQLADAMENEDWDCQGDSAYYDHPIIKRVWKDLDPDWEDWDEDEEED